ncbi:MAG: molybdopterin-synthase adenylyltransferase MoeB [Wenzhouxiangella sp.]|nr:MAG: molybdopterin-synthase adenylyltransferase MoeB [Wenzhouxiangella sp.]
MADERNDASKRLQRYLAGLSEKVAEIDVAAARARVADGAILLDIREPAELGGGTAAPALLISRGMLELEIGNLVPDRQSDLILMCAGGDRSRISAASLGELGYSSVSSLVGGFAAWRDTGGEIRQISADTGQESERYLRHFAMPEVGRIGQEKLAAAHVVLVGAGGLGSPAALYLAAAGIGHLTLVDADRVERSNLQRQILHSDHLVGHLKIESAAQRLHALNPDIRISTINQRLDADNAEAVIEAADVVVDGSDNFPTRYVLNAACQALGKPLVYGAVLRFQGQVALFEPGQGACYRCLFPEPPLPRDAPSCAEAGVLGVMPGVIGCLQATEVLKRILGIGECLQSRLLHFDALSMRFRTTRLIRDPECPDCGPRTSV